MKPKLSIVTPSYNLGKYIQRTIDSVLGQNYDNLEYWVIDGDSKDETVEILQQVKRTHPDKFHWISEPDRGQTHAINKGLERSSGDWFAWINADDYYEPNVLGKLAEVMANNSQAGVIYGRNLSHNKGKTVVDQPPKKVELNSFWAGNVIFGPAAFFNLTAVKAEGGFDEKLNYWMDYDMFIKLRKKYEFVYVDKLVSHFMVREGQKSTDPDQKLQMAWEAYRVCLANGGPWLSPLIDQVLPKPVSKLMKMFRRR